MIRSLIYALTINLLLCLSLNAKEVHVPALRTDEIGGVLGEVDCRMKGMPGYPWTNYRDDDKVTWAHEGTHSVNARIRNENGAANGFYLLGDHGVTFSNPSGLTLSQVARAVPREKRGRIYQLYMVQQARYWDDTPLYPFDELTCYINGALAGIENDMMNRAQQSFNNGVEMYYYAETAYKLCKQRNYQDIEYLGDLLTVCRRRLQAIGRMLDADFEARYGYPPRR